MNGPLLLRADASFGIGTGHVMRLMALAEAWRKYGGTESILLLGQVSLPKLRGRLTELGIGLWELLASHPDPGDLGALRNLAQAVHPAWIVVDGYHFDANYQEAVKALGIPLLVLDDLAHQSQYHAHLLLNQNVEAEKLPYTADPDTQFLLGPRYCLIRSELQAARQVMRATADDARARRVLITMGGADHRGLSVLAVQALAELGPGWEVKVVVGSGARCLHQLRQQAVQLAGVKILTNVRNMGALMTWADVAIATAGTTTWELAYLGVPTLLVAAADNQIAMARSAAALGCAVDLGWWAALTTSQLASALEQLVTNAAQRVAMTRAGTALLDGKGAERVIQAMMACPGQ